MTQDLVRQAAALEKCAEVYRSAVEVSANWKAMVRHDERANRPLAAALERQARAYVDLLRAALDLFEDGDLLIKYQTARQEAGLEAVE